MSHSIKYRHDLDGLRALAIIPVLLFHLGYEFFSGGYVGVDVFFVLSGYLISSILIKEIQEGKFQFSTFFLRRIRRLLPMALTIYMFCLVVFAFIYPNTYFQSVLNALLSATFFSSNIYFWQQGGYFSSHLLELNPLLHTWSLSVEEQFYFFFPVFLLVIFKISESKTLHAILISLCVITSLILAILYAPSNVSYAAFYLLPPRLYELGIGSLIAFFIYHNPDSEYRKIKYLKEVGILLITFSVFTFNDTTIFPSYNALIPVIGAALVIFSNTNNNSISNKILNQKHLVYIGLISYSLYLWHWPLIVLQNWIFTTDTNIYVPIATLVISFLLSILTYKFIETPFRNKQLIPNKKLLLIVLPLFAVLIVTAVIFKTIGNDMIVDKTGKINQTYELAIKAEPNRSECTDKIKHAKEFSYCEFKSTIEAPKTVFIWGDSHGSALMPAFKNMTDSYNIKFSNNTGCPPIKNTDRTTPQRQCKKINDLVIEHLLNTHYDLIVIVGAFNNYLNWELLKTTKYDSTSDELLADLSNNINELHTDFEQNKKQFIFINQPPRFKLDIPINTLRRDILGLTKKPQTITLEEYNQQSQDFKKMIPEKWHQHIFQPINLYCPDGICMSEENADLLYKDTHHVTNDYATKIGIPLKRFIDERLKDEE